MGWLALLQQPITQITAILAILAGLQKYGIDVAGGFKALFTNKETPTTDFDNRTALQSLMTQMETLSGHFNHETTELLSEIRDSLKENFAEIRAKHNEWDRRGIPTEECKNKK